MNKIVKSIMAAALLVAVGVTVSACGKGPVDVPAVGDHAGGNSDQPAK
jgi:predicted small lipoprotein YifL